MKEEMKGISQDPTAMRPPAPLSPPDWGETKGRKMRKPDFAAAVWSDGDWIYAEIPSVLKGGAAHTLRFTNDEIGINQILHLVRIRTHAAKIGTKVSPTQWQVDQKTKVRKMGKVKMVYTDAQAKKAKQILRQMGLI
jgi:hypothetical protein